MNVPPILADTSPAATLAAAHIAAVERHGGPLAARSQRDLRTLCDATYAAARSLPALESAALDIAADHIADHIAEDC